MKFPFKRNKADGGEPGGGVSGDPPVGRLGERAAARYLEKKGYGIVVFNFRAAGAEIDLIALKDETLCFIEVKTRKSFDFGMPEEFVHQRKRQRLMRAAKIFAARKKYADYYLRFDIVSVKYHKENSGAFRVEEIRHIENAFEE